MIARETIDEIKSRIDIIDVIGDFVTLKRSGQNYKALSPFTNEKTASFYVVPSKGIFKDFSSGKGGDGITFVMEHEGMSYLEALRYLAKKYGVEIKEEALAQEQLLQQTDRDSLYIVMNYAKDYYKELLFKTDEGRSIGLSYFRERGFHDRTIEKFELGFSISEWDHLHKNATRNGHSEEMLEKAGLVIKKESDGRTRIYDRFRGRVIFPVHNLAGKVVAFGARILTKEKDQPKYINSPETEIYHKSNVLYGLFQAKNAIRREEFCYLVEGYTDVISLHQADVDNVVASSGTALTEEQIKLIRRFSENVTVLFDGDAAGIKAALRGIDLVLKGGLNVRVVLLPDGEDPDSMSRKMGSSEFKQYLKAHTKDFISFKIDLYVDEAKDPIKKAEAIREIITSISLIPDPIKRSVYIQETGHLLKISESVLLSELNKIVIQERKKKGPEEAKREIEATTEIPEEISSVFKLDTKRMEEIQEREVIRLLINYADSELEEDIDLVSYFISEFEDLEFTNTTYATIYHEFYQAKSKGDLIDSNYFLSTGSIDVKRLIAELTTRKHYVSPHWADKYHIVFSDEKEKIQEHAHQNVLRRKYRYVQRLIEENKEKLKDAEKNKSNEEIDELVETQTRLKMADVEIAKQLGIVSGKY